MISIKDHLDVPHPEQYLKKLASEHWVWANRLNQDGSHNAYSTISACRAFKADSLDPDTKKKFNEKETTYREFYAAHDALAVERHQEFFSYLSDNNFENLKKLFVSEPEVLLTMAEEIGELLAPRDLYGADGKPTAFSERLTKKIFFYGRFRDSVYCSELFQKLQFSSATCPYCNRHPLEIIKIKVKDKLGEPVSATVQYRLKNYFQVDHYFAQSRHPYLALSFYNLIPSCSSCNAMDKLGTEFSLETHTHPYCESFDDIYEFQLPIEALWSKTGRVEIRAKHATNTRAGSLSVFNLEEKYAEYTPMALELYERFHRYEPRLRNGAVALFKDAVLHGMSLRREDILRSDRGKMKRDLVRQFDLHNLLKLK